jgi:hypothetical protein
MQAVRVIIQDGKYLTATKVFGSEEEAETFCNGFSAGAGEFGGEVFALDPFHDEARQFIAEAETPTEGWSDKPWATIFEEARALASPD